MAEARRAALYDSGKGKGDTKPTPKAAASKDSRATSHKTARDEMHKRHRTEHRDMHGRHRTERDQMHERHSDEIAAMDQQQDAAMMQPPSAAGPADVAAAGNLAGGAPAPVAPAGGVPAPAGG